MERGIVRRGIEGDPPHGRQEPRGGLLLVETAAHLVNHVFPRVPVRQWVLSFPWPLRLLFASRPDMLTRVLNVVTRALSTAVLKGAGLSRGAGARSGIVTSIQRFGSALNLNRWQGLLLQSLPGSEAPRSPKRAKKASACSSTTA